MKFNGVHVEKKKWKNKLVHKTRSINGLERITMKMLYLTRSQRSWNICPIRIDINYPLTNEGIYNKNIYHSPIILCMYTHL